MEFDSGFNVITGETGAGKSILLGGMSLALGKRADLKHINNPDKKCIVEVVFESNSNSLKEFFDLEELDWDPQIRLRRELTPSGKSRAFINDTPVRLELLAQLGSMLIDIHAQHQTLDLFSQKHQMAILDGFAGQSELLDEYRKLLKCFREDTKLLEELKHLQSERIKARDYQQFLWEELEEAQLRIGLKEELEEQQSELSNAASIIEQLSESHSLLNQDQYGLIDQLTSLRQSISKLSSYGSTYQQLFDRIESVLIELNDIRLEVENQQDVVEINPGLLEEVDAALQKLYNLENKHQVSSIEELIAVKDSLANQEMSFQEDQDRINSLEKTTKELYQQLLAIGEKLHQGRVSTIQPLEEALVDNLKQLGMPNARFQIVLSRSSDLNDLGINQLEFMFSANSGTAFGSLKKIASGGELSRIMLSIKAVLAPYIELSSILFDEIDSGVSGEISNKMADIMERLSQCVQVFSITHLPQVAAKGKHHFKVYKEDDGIKAQTGIVKLSDEQRIEEIAQMLDGKNYSASAQEHAKQLLHN